LTGLNSEVLAGEKSVLLSASGIVIQIAKVWRGHIHQLTFW